MIAVWGGVTPAGGGGIGVRTNTTAPATPVPSLATTRPRSSAACAGSAAAIMATAAIRSVRDTRAPYQAACPSCKTPPALATAARDGYGSRMAEHRYVAPNLATRIFNLLPMGLARLGISVWGSRTLAVRLGEGRVGEGG